MYFVVNGKLVGKSEEQAATHVAFPGLFLVACIRFNKLKEIKLLETHSLLHHHVKREMMSGEQFDEFVFEGVLRWAGWQCEA